MRGCWATGPGPGWLEDQGPRTRPARLRGQPVPLHVPPLRERKGAHLCPPPGIQEPDVWGGE